MRRSWMTTIATIAAAVSFGSSAAAANPHPNIVYILSDAQGWKDVGYHGSDIKTTNIDTLAQGAADAWRLRRVKKPARWSRSPILGSARSRWASSWPQWRRRSSGR